MELSVVYPVHNEEAAVDRLVSYTHTLLTKARISHEIICVENGSTDATFTKLSLLAKKFRELVVVQSEKGWGNAVIKGIATAKGNYVCYSVSDFQVDPKHIPEIYEKITHSNFAMVKVHRTTRENRTRKVNSRLYNTLASLLFGIGSYDINATPKIMKRSQIRKFPFESHNISIDLELMLYLQARKLSWIEIPVLAGARKTGKSTTNWKSVCEMLQYMMYFWLSKSFQEPSNKSMQNRNTNI